LDNPAIVIPKSHVTPSVRAEPVEASCEPVNKVRNWKRWAADNAEAIAHYNARIEREGLFSDRHRTFMRSPRTNS
jgi:Post-segregation antitoxin CcdA